MGLKILVRGFNDHINSKTGQELPYGQKRGTKDWLVFQNILIDCLKSLGHYVECYEEHPILPPMPTLFPIDRRIVVHKCKRDEDFDLTFMQMHMRELFTIDTNGWGVDHSHNNFKPRVVNEEESKEFCETKSKELLHSKISKCEQPERTGETSKSFILIPIQIPRDYTIKYHSPITVNFFIESIRDWAIKNKETVCFKMHPHNKGDIDLHKLVDDAVSLSPYIHKIEGNIHELIKRSSGLFVINSGTGFEAILHGKPVCTFGSCDYSQVSFNADIHHISEARDFIHSYQPKHQHLAYQFIYWYYHNHAYDITMSNTKERLKEYLRTHL